MLVIGTAIFDDWQVFLSWTSEHFIQNKVFSKKRSAFVLLSPMCWSIHHRTTVYIDNSTKAKNRDILLIGPGHMLKTGTVPAKTVRMVSLLILLEINF